ncbi:hypothetical protein Tco_1544274, partial [Tanacetum coccineum]
GAELRRLVAVNGCCLWPVMVVVLSGGMAMTVMVVVGMTTTAGGYEVEGGDVVCDVADLVVTMWRQRWWCSVVALAGEGCGGWRWFRSAVGSRRRRPDSGDGAGILKRRGVCV